MTVAGAEPPLSLEPPPLGPTSGSVCGAIHARHLTRGTSREAPCGAHHRRELLVARKEGRDPLVPVGKLSERHLPRGDQEAMREREGEG